MRSFILWIVAFLWAQACMPRTDRVTLWLNKPGVELRTPSAEIFDALHKNIEGAQLRVGKNEQGISWITLRLRERPIERPVILSSSVDLRPWFEESDCLVNWDLFHECMSERRNPHDEKLYRKLDRQFVSKLICEEGHHCIDPTFPLWRLDWRAPAQITLEAEIGKGGFATLDAAKESLHRINALLKKGLYGARFPESYDEGLSAYKTYFVRELRSPRRDFKAPLIWLLNTLKKSGDLKGVSEREISQIGSKAQGGAILYYRPKGCPDEGNPEDRHLVEVHEGNKTVLRQIKTDAPTGWRSLRAMASVSFDEKMCPRFAFMKCR
ncbi:hypothetical protein [Nitratifractor sp.]